MHTCISTLALVHARQHGAVLYPRRPRLVFRLFLPAVILLQIATLYLRQHYFVDLVAGWGLAAVSLALAGRAMAAWDRLTFRAADPPSPMSAVRSALAAVRSRR